MVTWFFILHPVTLYGQNFEKQKCLELVTSLFDYYSLNLQTVEREEKKRQNIEQIEGKNIFKNF